MAKKNTDQTSPKVASKAGKALGDKKSPPNTKSIAGSALDQAPPKSKPKKKS